MSAVELRMLAQRMQEAKRAAACRGELRLPLPTGYAYGIDGQVLMDPGQEVQAAVGDVFRAFEQPGAAAGWSRRSGTAASRPTAGAGRGK